MKFFNNQKLTSGLILSLLLWLLIWTGYNINPGPLNFSNFLDFFHSTRAFFPLLAAFLALIFLIRRPFSLKISKTPLGLLALYALIGIISSIFLSPKPFLALYWAISYIAVILVLLAILTDSDSKSYLPSLINLNWLFVFIITIFLFLFFLFQPGGISAVLDFGTGRPYEGLANVPAEKEILGMVGTRPTGWGRYAGVAALVALAMLLSDKRKLKLSWFFLFLIFYFLLLFSQAKTAIFGFIFGAFIIFLLTSQSKKAIFGWSFLTLFQLVLVGAFFFYIPLFYTPHLLEKAAISEPRIVILEPSVPISEPSVSILEPAVPTPQPSLTEKMTPVSTLSGRTVGVWPQVAKLFLKSPLIGWGFHADRIFLEGQHAHNAILHVLIQTGIIGIIPFISAFILAWILLFKLLKNSSLTEKPFLIATAGILAFFIIRGITESTGAFFGMDLILLAPLIAYIQNLWFQNKSNQLKS